MLKIVSNNSFQLISISFEYFIEETIFTISNYCWVHKQLKPQDAYRMNEML